MADKTILVADDEKAICRIMKRVLSREGYDVVTVNDASDAISVLQDSSRSVDMILSDNDMGDGLSGLEFAALVRGTHNPEDSKFAGKEVPTRYRNIPFALVTGADPLTVAVLAEKLGIDYVQKQADPQALNELITQYIG